MSTGPPQALLPSKYPGHHLQMVVGVVLPVPGSTGHKGGVQLRNDGSSLQSTMQYNQPYEVLG